MSQKKEAIKWFKKPEQHDYPAALSYLTLIYEKHIAVSIVKELEKVKIIHFKAKDVFRASGLSLLGISNSHVKRNRKKIAKGESMSPILLVRSNPGKVVVADGYHRLCAVYSFDENATIPCKIISSVRS